MRASRSFILRLCVLFLVAVPVVQAAGDRVEPIVIKDLQFGEALFHFYQEDYVPAIVRLLVAKEQNRLPEHAEEADLLLGGMYLSYGHHLEAAEIFEDLLAGNVSPDIRDRTWFFLAKIWYQRGYLDKAQDALANIAGELPENLENEAAMLGAQIQIDAGDFDRAIAGLTNWKGKTEWARYAKFNTGVALVRSGRIEEARVLLDELGSMAPYNDETSALRDKANVALGYALLQDGQPQAAKIPLQRVRLEGPFSNKALLGVGWADAEMSSYRRALVPWMELRGRNLLDSAVQESLLAIPYAMAKLDAISQAADHYLNAIEAFHEESNRLDRTIGFIESGDFFDQFIADDSFNSSGWYWNLQELPEGPEARYIFHLLATHQFQEGLKNYRDLNYLDRNIEHWLQNVDVFENMLETRKEAYEQRLPEVEAALERADLDRMVESKLSFDATVDNIKNSHDWLSLAKKSEFDMWDEVTGLERSPAVQAEIPEAAEVRDKVDLLKGVLQWNLERDFNERLEQIRRDLYMSGEALVETQRSRRQIDEVMRTEPLRFQALSDRVYGLGPRLEGTRMQIADAMLRQREFLQEIAVEELQAQKDRLGVYSVQARFALAAIYDISSSSEEGSE